MSSSAGRLADEHQVGIRVSHAEDHLGPGGASGQRVHPAPRPPTRPVGIRGPSAASYRRKPRVATSQPVTGSCSGRLHGRRRPSPGRPGRGGRRRRVPSRRPARRGAAVDVRAERGRLGGPRPGEEGPDHPGEHVTGAGGGERRRTRRASRTCPVGAATTVVAPFRSTTAAGRASQAAGGLDPVGPGGPPTSRSNSPSCGVSTWEPPGGERPLASRPSDEPVGVEDDRDRRPRHQTAAPRRRSSPAEARAEHSAATAELASTARPTDAGNPDLDHLRGRHPDASPRGRRDGPSPTRPDRASGAWSVGGAGTRGSGTDVEQRTSTCCLRSRARHDGLRRRPPATIATSPTAIPRSTTVTTPAIRPPSPRRRPGFTAGRSRSGPPAPPPASRAAVGVDPGGDVDGEDRGARRPRCVVATTNPVP